MTDDVKAALARFRATMTDERAQMDEGTFNALWGDDALVLAHIDGEPARTAAAVAAARERMHRCDAYVMFGAPEFADVTFCRKDGARAAQDVLEERNDWRERAEKAEAERDAYAEEAGKAILAMPTGHYRTIPLFQAIRELRQTDLIAVENERDRARERLALQVGLAVKTPLPLLELVAHVERLLMGTRAEREALRAQVDKLRTDLANADAAYAGDVSAQRVRAERAEAQVEAARAMAAMFKEGDLGFPGAQATLAAMDGAKP